MTKRFLAAAALLLLLALLPTAALAEGNENITLTALEGTAGNSGENYDKLVDGNTSSGKWCLNLPEGGAYVIIEASDVIKVTGYTLTTGNDTKDSGRNPKSWTLYGCNDYIGAGTGTWKAIDTVTDDTKMPNDNYKSHTFSISNDKYYKYYKLHITAIKSTESETVMQLGELEFTVDNSHTHSWGNETTIIATCTTPKSTSKTCSECGTTVTAPVNGDGAIAPLDHDYGNLTTGKCTRCGISCPAKVGDTYYASIEMAFNNANGGTVTLLQDVEITETLTVNSGNTVTLDLNGHSLKRTDSNDYHAIDVKGTFILKDSAGGGTLSYPKGTAVYIHNVNSANFIMESGTITDSGTGVDIYKQTFTMNGGVIKNCGIANAGTMYAHGGEVYGSVRNFYNEYPGMITRKDNTTTSTVFYGGIVNASGDTLRLYNGTIKWGTFYGDINNYYSAKSNADESVTNTAYGAISGGTFYGDINGYDSNKVTGGTFFGTVYNNTDDKQKVDSIGSTVSVTFVYPDGKSETKSAAVSGSAVLNGGPNCGTREGCTLTWYSDAACTTPYTFGKTAAENGMTLYAKWVRNGAAQPASTGGSTSLWYAGGNSFGSSRSAIPTAVEIDGVPVSFTGTGSSFTVSSLSSAARWVTVRWNSTSVTINFTPDANAYTAEVAIPKTGDMPMWAAIAGFLGL